MPLQSTSPELTPATTASLYSLSHLKKRLYQGLMLGQRSLRQWLFTQPEADAIAAHPVTTPEGDQVWQVCDARTQVIEVFYTESEARTWCEKHYLR
jgi:hypothetical protein